MEFFFKNSFDIFIKVKNILVLIIKVMYSRIPLQNSSVIKKRCMRLAFENRNLLCDRLRRKDFLQKNISFNLKSETIVASQNESKLKKIQGMY